MDLADHDLPTTWPGAPEHQRLLRAMTVYHARQSWALAFLVFGSVARGDWSERSDLDLDVVIADGVALDPMTEIRRLCAAIGERPALIAPRRGDDGDVVLESLAEFSIRYHPLAATSPNIVSSMRLLWGQIDEARIRAAGLANGRPSAQMPDALVALCVRATLGGTTSLERGRLWSALAALEEARELLMTLFAQAHGEERPLRDFQRLADAQLQAVLARTVAVWDFASVRAALLALCDLLAERLDDFAGGRARLTAEERAALTRIRARLAGPAVSETDAPT
ncbi:MAG TPA: nucleotidyltransferase domain-containing protein [Ktedonobacterales bacterium]|jgi:predicted nucleotidyltransferase|nr:nucleotidyltransferase domain-containing protein [Ktedonobacterales bacterium]